ncbi:hypothetical protein GOBAR_AA33854 [Gossypium barbadense]|uniref:Uncharacterized protein n=1 Tax=Gossypium barbadense TaxID=3634 RepID=A0A2P5W6Y8_GOSBA|nr:hypothetical protein GOBAR_AA33854 [Gossypium barbadense]
MERTTETAPSSSMQVPQTIERGVGGKPRRQPPHRPPATPYARPQQNQFLRGRFLSKLVDSGLPSLNLGEDIEEHPSGKDQISSSTFGVSKIANTSGTSDGSKAGLDFVEKRKGVDSEIKDDKYLEIEKLMEEKTFSRGEINHMIEIMNSRSADVPKVHQECKDIILSARGAKDTIGPQNLRRPTEGKQDDSNKAVWDVATPLPKPTLPNETGCSPIELAKAYVTNRTPELDHVQDKGNGFLNGSFSPLQQLQTPIYGQSLDANRSSKINIPPVHLHSSHMERSILEHLERNLVTPKEKSEVLKIATSSKISESSDANASYLPCLGLDSSKSKNQINNRWNEDRGK